MPFSEPWSKYKPGDLIYGLQEPRGEFINALKKAWKASGDCSVGSNLDFCTIDNYEIAQVQRTHSTMVYDPAFIDALEAHEKYNYVSEKGNSGYDLTDIQRRRSEPWIMGAIAKRKCKGGLDWIIHKTEGRNIHFCLEGINITGVIGKCSRLTARHGRRSQLLDYRYDDPLFIRTLFDKDYRTLFDKDYDVENKTRSVTGSELRWIYRNRQDNSVIQKVQFWKRNDDGSWESCSPPWSDDCPGSGDWKAYTPRKQYNPP